MYVSWLLRQPWSGFENSFFVWKGTVLWWYYSPNQDMMRESRGYQVNTQSLMICFYTFTDFSVNNYGKIKSDWNLLNFKTILKFFSYIWGYTITCKYFQLQFCFWFQNWKLRRTEIQIQTKREKYPQDFLSPITRTQCHAKYLVYR